MAGKRVPGAIGPGYLPKGGARKALEMAADADLGPKPRASGGVPVGSRPVASDVRAPAVPVRGSARVGGWLTTERLAWIGALSGTCALLGSLVEAITR